MNLGGHHSACNSWGWGRNRPRGFMLARQYDGFQKASKFLSHLFSAPTRSWSADHVITPMSWHSTCCSGGHFHSLVPHLAPGWHEPPWCALLTFLRSSQIFRQPAQICSCFWWLQIYLVWGVRDDLGMLWGDEWGIGILPVSLVIRKQWIPSLSYNDFFFRAQSHTPEIIPVNVFACIMEVGCLLLYTLCHYPYIIYCLLMHAYEPNETIPCILSYSLIFIELNDKLQTFSPVNKFSFLSQPLLASQYPLMWIHYNFPFQQSHWSPNSHLLRFHQLWGLSLNKLFPNTVRVQMFLYFRTLCWDIIYTPSAPPTESVQVSGF